MKMASPVENLAEDATEMTDHADFSTGYERLFAVYARQIAGHDPLLTCSVNFLTGHA